MNRGIFISIMSFVLIVGVYVAACVILPGIKFCRDADMAEESVAATGESDNRDVSYSHTVVIDAGHGGIDPGTISITGMNEKDINLSIALKLCRLLTDKGFKVVMTRTQDMGLYQETDSNKKSSDMKKRVSIINNSDAELAVSIHQNSYQSDSSVKGFQAMYYNGSEAARLLASKISESYEDMAGAANLRNIQTDNSLYILKNTTIPVSIVECGFLTNDWEAAKLEQTEYQQLLAEVICNGIMEYFNEGNVQRQ